MNKFGRWVGLTRRVSVRGLTGLISQNAVFGGWPAVQCRGRGRNVSGPFPCVLHRGGVSLETTVALFTVTEDSTRYEQPGYIAE
jgi:hypothetical protein